MKRVPVSAIVFVVVLAINAAGVKACEWGVKQFKNSTMYQAESCTVTHLNDGSKLILQAQVTNSKGEIILHSESIVRTVRETTYIRYIEICPNGSFIYTTSLGTQVASTTTHCVPTIDVEYRILDRDCAHQYKTLPPNVQRAFFGYHGIGEGVKEGRN